MMLDEDLLEYEHRQIVFNVRGTLIKIDLLELRKENKKKMLDIFFRLGITRLS
jgi:hypothetical protein